jgi:hypothetical protein
VREADACRPATSSRDQARFSAGTRLDQLAGMRRISDIAGSSVSKGRFAPQRAAIEAAWARVTVALPGSYGRSNSPGSPCHSGRPSLIAWATSGQRTRASKYGSPLSGNTRYCTSATSDPPPHRNPGSRLRLGLRESAKVRSSAESSSGRHHRVLDPRTANCLLARPATSPGAYRPSH